MGGSNLQGEAATYGMLAVPSATNIPSARFGAVTWTDPSGNFWLFGGFGYDVNGSNGGKLNDLWKYTNGQWTWESGSQVKNQSGVYGMQGLPAPANVPGARYWGVGWTDASGNLWLFGGSGYNASGNSGRLNDLWKYSNGQWTWISGTSQLNEPGIYGVQGMAAAANIPGSRQNALSWTDASGNFWLFGGNGADSAAQEGVLQRPLEIQQRRMDLDFRFKIGQPIRGIRNERYRSLRPTYPALVSKPAVGSTRMATSGSLVATVLQPAARKATSATSGCTCLRKHLLNFSAISFVAGQSPSRN